MKSPFASLNWGVLSDSKYMYLVNHHETYLDDENEINEQEINHMATSSGNVHVSS